MEAIIMACAITSLMLFAMFGVVAAGAKHALGAWVRAVQTSALSFFTVCLFGQTAAFNDVYNLMSLGDPHPCMAPTSRMPKSIEPKWQARWRMVKYLGLGFFFAVLRGSRAKFGNARPRHLRRLLRRGHKIARHDRSWPE